MFLVFDNKSCGLIICILLLVLMKFFRFVFCVLGVCFFGVVNAAGSVYFSSVGESRTFDTEQNGVEFGRFRLENVSEVGVELKSVTLRNVGSLGVLSVLGDLVLYEAGYPVSTETVVSGESVVFKFSDKRGNGAIFNSGRRSDFSIVGNVVFAGQFGTIQFVVPDADGVGVVVGEGFDDVEDCVLGVSRAEGVCGLLNIQHIGNASVEYLPFSDIDVEDIDGRAVLDVFNRRIVHGFPDGEFKGERFVNRAEIVKILLLARGIEDVGGDVAVFPDVPEDVWFFPYVMEAVEIGMIGGDPDGNFYPARTVNTAEFLKMFSKTFGLEENLPHFFKDVSDEWFSGFVGVVPKYSLFPSQSSVLLEPSRDMTRYDVVVALYQYFLSPPPPLPR